jgi:hypothetical protein
MEVAMRLTVREISSGLHPSEVVIEVHMVDGPERLVVDRGSVRGNTIFVGWRAIAEKKSQLLVELPRETMSGTWRVWVGRSEIAPRRSAIRDRSVAAQRLFADSRPRCTKYGEKSG